LSDVEWRRLFHPKRTTIPAHSKALRLLVCLDYHLRMIRERVQFAQGK
jgi:hypothetical protein